MPDPHHKSRGWRPVRQRPVEARLERHVARCRGQADAAVSGRRFYRQRRGQWSDIRINPQRTKRMPKDEFDFEDPFELNGMALLSHEDTTGGMAECFIEEFMRMGYGHTKVLA